MVEDALSDNESPGERTPLLPPLLLRAFKDLFQTLHVVVVIPTDRAPRNLKTLLNSEVDTAVGDDNVSTFAKRGDDG